MNDSPNEVIEKKTRQQVKELMNNSAMEQFLQITPMTTRLYNRTRDMNGHYKNNVLEIENEYGTLRWELTESMMQSFIDLYVKQMVHSEDWELVKAVDETSKDG